MGWIKKITDIFCGLFKIITDGIKASIVFINQNEKAISGIVALAALFVAVQAQQVNVGILATQELTPNLTVTAFTPETVNCADLNKPQGVKVTISNMGNRIAIDSHLHIDYDYSNSFVSAKLFEQNITIDKPNDPIYRGGSPYFDGIGTSYLFNSPASEFSQLVRIGDIKPGETVNVGLYFRPTNIQCGDNLSLTFIAQEQAIKELSNTETKKIQYSK